MNYLTQTIGLRDNDFLNFDAMRQVSQCAGRVFRSKKDYGLMVFADQRFSRKDKQDKFPLWIRNNLSADNNQLSVDIVKFKANHFFKEMG
jgi:DNA excision repair protein ERCC-2